MGGSGNGENAGSTGTVIDTLLKFITLDKLGVSLHDGERKASKGKDEPDEEEEDVPEAAAAKEDAVETMVSTDK